MKCWLVRFSPPTQPTTHELQKQNVNKMSNFWHAQKLKTIRFKIFTLEIKWILYFFLAYLKVWNVSLQSILKTKTFFKKKVSFERIVEHGSVFSLLICGLYSILVLLYLKCALLSIKSFLKNTNHIFKGLS